MGLGKFRGAMGMLMTLDDVVASWLYAKPKCSHLYVLHVCSLLLEITP